MTDRIAHKTLAEVDQILAKADRLEAEERANPKPKKSYSELMAERAGLTIEQYNARMGYK